MEYKFLKDKDIIKFTDKFLHLSYSSEKEVAEFFKELRDIKNISFFEFIENNLEKNNIVFNNNNKHNTTKFLKIIREYKNPIMTKVMNKIKGLSNSIKSKIIKVDYPENLEGDTLTLTISIKDEEEVERFIEDIQKNKENIKKLITTIKKGG